MIGLIATMQRRQKDLVRTTAPHLVLDFSFRRKRNARPLALFSRFGPLSRAAVYSVQIRKAGDWLELLEAGMPEMVFRHPALAEHRVLAQLAVVRFAKFYSLYFAGWHAAAQADA
ncbi:MAG: hypothetical protein GKS00_10830 [Alphaproteobacteria bacterium]|nr:hypothetical protein [Alphaproteobacteria bacterium]